MAAPPPPLDARVRELEASIADKYARKRRLQAELEGLEVASNKKRVQIELIASRVPEIGASPLALRMLEAAVGAAESTESAREVAREVPVLRARVVAAEQAVSPRALAEAEKWCLLTNVPRP